MVHYGNHIKLLRYTWLHNSLTCTNILNVTQTGALSQKQNQVNVARLNQDKTTKLLFTCKFLNSLKSETSTRMGDHNRFSCYILMSLKCHFRICSSECCVVVVFLTLTSHYFWQVTHIVFCDNNGMDLKYRFWKIMTYVEKNILLTLSYL